jgi:hypothetical protein
MIPVGYDTIAPNIAHVDVDGAVVHVSWKCPVTGQQVAQSTANMSADTSVTARVQASVKRSIASEIIYGAARLAAGLLGGAAGRVISNAAYTAAGDINQRVTVGVDYTEASRQAAIVTAFEAVQASFVWDEQQRQFVAKANPTTTAAP